MRGEGQSQSQDRAQIFDEWQNACCKDRPRERSAVSMAPGCLGLKAKGKRHRSASEDDIDAQLVGPHSQTKPLPLLTDELVHQATLALAVHLRQSVST